MHGPMFPFLFHILIHFSINHTEKKTLSDGTVNVGTVVNISIHFEIAYNYKRRVYNIYVHYKKKPLKDSILEHTCKEKKTHWELKYLMCGYQFNFAALGDMLYYFNFITIL